MVALTLVLVLPLIVALLHLFLPNFAFVFCLKASIGFAHFSLTIVYMSCRFFFAFIQFYIKGLSAKLCSIFSIYVALAVFLSAPLPLL